MSHKSHPFSRSKNMPLISLLKMIMIWIYSFCCRTAPKYSQKQSLISRQPVSSQNLFTRNELNPHPLALLTLSLMLSIALSTIKRKSSRKKRNSWIRLVFLLTLQLLCLWKRLMRNTSYATEESAPKRVGQKDQ